MAATGTEQEPVLFSMEQLKRHAVHIAEHHRISIKKQPDGLLKRLAHNEQQLLAAYHIVSRSAQHSGSITSPAENWLLDNFYLIEQQIALVRQHLPPGYSRQLPKVQHASLPGCPRVYDIAIEVILHTDGRVDADNISNFIASYQTVSTLRLGELWAVPIMLRLALLENLRQIAEHIAAQRRDRNLASDWAQRMIDTAADDPKRLTRLLAEFADADIDLSSHFAEQFESRLPPHDATLNFIRAWIEQKLTEKGQSSKRLAETTSHMAATDQLSIANSIGSLRFLDTMDWKQFVESLSAVERVLAQDPGGTYAVQDFTTRDRCRHAVETMARDSQCTEVEVAEAAIGLAREAAAQNNTASLRKYQVGYYLINRGRKTLMDLLGCRPSWSLRFRRAKPKVRLTAYLGSILTLTLIINLLALALFNGLQAGHIDFWLMAATGLLSGSALAVALINLLVTLIMPTRTLARLDFSGGIPPEHLTIVVVPTLLTSPQSIEQLLDTIEVRYLGNRDPNLLFALLTDFADAQEQHLPEDQALLDALQQGIQALNKRYADKGTEIFHLFHRPRTWNGYDELWSGYERKRGKLEQFNALLRGGPQEPYSLIIGDVERLQSVRYVITLDTDTQLPRKEAQLLVGYMAHPLNRPVYQPKAGRVIEGFGILQPRTSSSLESANQTIFSRLFAGDSGIDPYTREVSDVYQDLFAEGSYIGKGIYDVDAFRKATEGRFPENLILSHDLIESGHARSALVSDVVLIEDHPASYTADASRRHRWMRGDWQLAGWLLPRVPGPGARGAPRQHNPLSGVTIWKLFDNIRRNLVAPALLGFLLGGWILGTSPIWLWTVLWLSLILLPAMTNTLISIVRKPARADWLLHLQLAGANSCRPLLRALLTVVFLPYEAVLSLDALVRSGLRMLFTRRGLLRWQLPHYASSNNCHTIGDFAREMWVGPAMAAAIFVLAIVTDTRLNESWITTVPILLAWLLSPLLGWWVSRPISTKIAELNTQQKRFLRNAARRTWHYFSSFTNSEHHWLIPDNIQIHPDTRIAARTSPTNIGMSLLANLTALDFGHTDTRNMLDLTQRIFYTLQQLPRHRGHFYNWYDTQTLEVLPPHYISSVDSGNLAGALVALQQGLGELPDRAVVPKNLFAGLEDTLQLCIEDLPETASQHIIESWQTLVATIAHHDRNMTALSPRTLMDALQDIRQRGQSLLDSVSSPWAEQFVQQCQGLLDELTLMVPEPQHFEHLPTLTELADSAHAADAALQRLALIRQLQQQCREFMDMDFRFLYDHPSELLSVGYDVGERRLDPACYDLLASESRLAVFLLIAWDQVPQKYWFNLGRLLTAQDGAVSLVSWSGSMFEYLMPQLLLRNYENTLLDQACRAAVARQIEYGRKRGVPWGISESCYSVTDANQTYQYRAFGVPGLGLKRGLADDLVIAPYASALALTVNPVAACDNLNVLAAQGFMGEYGFFEAIDYTASRLPRGKSHIIVRSFMAHHQGMSLLAYAHVLLNQPMQRRMMADSRVRSAELLLHERIPSNSITVQPHMAEVSAAWQSPVGEEEELMRIFTTAKTSWPEVHLLSNGQYHLMVTQAGSSYSHFQDLALTRWREDSTCDNHGLFVYLRDRESADCWCATHQPLGQRPAFYEAIFVRARAEFRRIDHDIRAHTEICVSPEDNVEIRRLTLTNQSSRERHIEVTSYAEVVLAPFNADMAHPAFSNLTVTTEILREKSAILCTRRPRQASETPRWMFQLLAVPRAVSVDPSFETDRLRFVGRGRTVANPLMLDKHSDSAQLSNTDGSVLDPIVAIRRTLILSADETATVQIISGTAETREEALAMIDRYLDHYVTERAFELAWFRSQEVARHLDISGDDIQLFGRLASPVIYSHARLRAAAATITRNRLGQSSLWRFAISGDLPIVLVEIGDIKRLALLRQILKAHAYWRMKGLKTDLVIINEDFSGYRATLQDDIIGLLNAEPDLWERDRPGGVFLRRIEDLSEDERVLLQATARMVIDDKVETLAMLLQRSAAAEPLPKLLKPRRPALNAEPLPLPASDHDFDNGIGGFSRDGREYIISLAPGTHTPAPWVNVIASPHIGTVISESGGAYTWVENAHELRLTNWHNDPVTDNSGEALYIRDDDTGEFWSPTPLPAPSRAGHICRHGFGYSVFEHTHNGISATLTTFVAMDAPVKFALLTLHNRSADQRQLSVTAYWELVLGTWRHNNMHIVTDVDGQSGALLAHNAYNRTFDDRLCFASVSRSDISVTGNRTEFIGRNGNLASPAAMRRGKLSNRTGAALDPCAAIRAPLELAPEQSTDIVLLFGATDSLAEVRQLIQRFGEPNGARQALNDVHTYWQETLGTLQVSTPDRALDILANGWLLYQTLSCRIWGRSGYYQSGGAYGFRDQLQDSMALIHSKPELTREQILRCASRQFTKGDVQHWWHPPEGPGVRTHFSDDYLWLPWVCCHYVTATGDSAVLDVKVPFLESRELHPEEESSYGQPQCSAERASLYEHCVRAIHYGLKFGQHGLPLMGCGDWNDGMNRVGIQGRGESVWLGWFLLDTLQRFANLATAQDDADFAAECRAQARQLQSNIETQAWDGGWYQRAWFDDGTPLGSANNTECQLDAISQSWAVLSSGGAPERQTQAMEAVYQRLVRQDAQLIQLLDPPFDKSDLEPGYIKGYPPGVRENGGQYTHAAIWTTMAFARLGDCERSWELYRMLNPIHHGSTAAAIETYRVEPYVMSADIYSKPPHTGRGGWSWYTGASGWMYRLLIETLLGLYREGEYLRIAPCLPPDWTSYRMDYRYGQTWYQINVKCCSESATQVARIAVDDQDIGNAVKDGQPGGRFRLDDDGGTHTVTVELDQQEHPPADAQLKPQA